MKIPRSPHSWNVTPLRAVTIQRKLATRVRPVGLVRNLHLVAGVDLAFSGDDAIAGVVVWDVRAGEVVEQRVICRPVSFPYVPGLLSFREAPAILAVLRELRCTPDAFMFDGQGLAHPRRFGLACHVGVLLDRPSLGCAKSILVGACRFPALSRGSSTKLIAGGDYVGRAVRTRDNVKPVYVSVGHRLSLDEAVNITLATGNGYRLPAPTRLADKLVARARQFPSTA